MQKIIYANVLILFLMLVALFVVFRCAPIVVKPSSAANTSLFQRAQELAIENLSSNSELPNLCIRNGLKRVTVRILDKPCVSNTAEGKCVRGQSEGYQIDIVNAPDKLQILSHEIAHLLLRDCTGSSDSQHKIIRW